MICLVTPQETLFIDDWDCIYRPQVGIKPSAHWRVTGAIEYRFGRIIKKYSTLDIRKNKVPWRYLNGSPRCFITDIDHGTKRIWNVELLDVIVK
jgi:hypothetical protein